MKSFFRILLLFSLLVLACSTALARTGKLVEKTTVYADADKKSDKITTLKKGKKVTILEDDGKWLLIEIDCDGYNSGYIRSDSLEPESSTMYVAISGDLFSQASENSRKIAKLYMGRKVKVLKFSGSGDWAKIEYKDDTAYILSRYLSPEKMSTKTWCVSVPRVDMHTSPTYASDVRDTLRVGDRVAVVRIIEDVKETEGDYKDSIYDWAEICYAGGFAYICTDDLKEYETIWVYTSDNDPRYHKSESCPALYDNPVRYSIQRATRLKCSPCPICYKEGIRIMTNGWDTVHVSANGESYHTGADCGDETGMTEATLLSAVNRGAKRCKTCGAPSPKYEIVDNYKGKLYEAGETTVYVSSDKAAKGISGKYHLDPTCSGLKEPLEMTINEAKKQNFWKCSKCCIDQTEETVAQEKIITDDEIVYVAQDLYNNKKGGYYHSKTNCSGMTSVYKIAASRAWKHDFRPCPKCNPGTPESYSGNGTGDVSSIITTQTTVYVLKTEFNGNTPGYFHLDSGCGGMTVSDVYKLSVERAQSKGFQPCPDCMSGITIESNVSITTETTVYVLKTDFNEKTPTYFHIKTDCSEIGDQGIYKLSAQRAHDNGFAPCPVCLPGVTDAVFNGGSQESLPTATIDGSETVYVRPSQYDEDYKGFFHIKASCDSTEDMEKVTAKEAENKGFVACPVCLPGVNVYVPIDVDDSTTVYVEKSTYDSGSSGYYHKQSSCGGMDSTYSMSISKAKSHKLSPCPICQPGN